MKTIIKIWLQMMVALALLFSVASAEVDQTQSDEDIFLYKTIPGDSLWNIAQRHLHSIKLWIDLKKINQLPNDDYIEPGTLIKVPRKWLKTNQSTATLVSAIGAVKVVNSNQQTLEFGQDFTEKDNLVLVTGDVILTGDDGLATILFKDGSRLLLQSNSELILNDLIALGDGSLSDIKLQLDKGRLENRVYSSPISNTNYEVKTATATTSVRGTVFRMGFDNEDSVTEVVTGKVATKAQSDAVAELVAGQAIIISKDGESKQVEMLPAPEFANFPQLIEAVPIKIDVEAIDNVTGYATKIIPVGSDEQDAVSSMRSEGNVLLGNDLPDGRYQAMISAIDQNGVTGQPGKYEFILNARPFAAVLTTPAQDEKVLLRHLTFTWDKANDEAKTFYLQVARDNNFRDIVIDADNLSEPTYKPEDLLSGIYFWRVASIDENGKRGPFSAIKDFRILLEDPNLEKANVKTADIQLEWAALEEGTQYLIQISDNIAFEKVLLEQSLSDNQLFVENLVPGIYFFRIQSTASDGYVSEWGLPHQFEVLDIQSVSEKIKP
ncbi:FecR domain-containing protein [Wohlfahrtiimonas larvae]|uniref:LysM domain-containing protein n=1 Tax=Wohlfahrtiimonas larvae TaxID=1157986 RepID=A0ABP9MJ34_9GAMM|nr:FecR domain-containing protein [Wohlfahrtiimonas larvae]